LQSVLQCNTDMISTAEDIIQNCFPNLWANIQMKSIYRIVLLLFLLCFVTAETFAVAPKKTVAHRDSTGMTKAQRDWNKFVTFADNWFSRGIDTTYLVLPKYRWRVALNSEAGAVHTFLKANDVPFYGDIKSQFNSNVTPKLGLQLSFRNLNVGYSMDLYKGYSNFSLSMVQNAFGLEILRRKTFYANGYIDASEVEDKTKIEAGDISVTTLFVAAYFAFNRKKFSMPAAFNQSFIQRKSAGSVLAYIDFRYSDLAFEKESYMTRAGGLHELEMYQLAIGVGYGYNYTPNNGKVLLHLSVTPMLSVFNHTLMTGDSRMFWHNDDEDYNLVFSRKLKGRYPVFFTGMVRAAVVWNINDRLVLALTGVCNNIRFRMRDKMFDIDREDIDLYYNTVVNGSIMTWDWKTNIVFGVRF